MALELPVFLDHDLHGYGQKGDAEQYYGRYDYGDDGFHLYCFRVCETKKVTAYGDLSAPQTGLEPVTP